MILNMENIYKELIENGMSFDSINCEETAQEHFNENDNLEQYLVEDSYNERPMMEEFFKRFTVKLLDISGYEEFLDRLVTERCWIWENVSSIDRELQEKMYELQRAEKLEEQANEYQGESYDDLKNNIKLEKDKILKEIAKLQKEHDKLEKNYDKVRAITNNLTLDEWNANKAPDGAKLLKRCKQYGARKEFLDWATTQEKTNGKLVQVTINPTIQAVTGMSNFAKERSWDGYNGTSCQDTRHYDENYCLSLLGALSDDKMYIVQLNDLEDNEPAFVYYKENGTLEGYSIADNEDDILFSGNFQDKLKARANARLWDFLQSEQQSYRDSEQEQALVEWLKGLKATERNVWFLKTIKGYGTTKTRRELSVALDEIAEVFDIVGSGI